MVLTTTIKPLLTGNQFVMHALIVAVRLDPIYISIKISDTALRVNFIIDILLTVNVLEVICWTRFINFNGTF